MNAYEVGAHCGTVAVRVASAKKQRENWWVGEIVADERTDYFSDRFIGKERFAELCWRVRSAAFARRVLAELIVGVKFFGRVRNRGGSRPFT